ncbi:unnamed protein product [Kuraishia capsulata CBS 1993]|uniref:Uncharacterized protein n=1 Tax=Kuraishia capsulata CBS 1993 TaxID=1382522 RepID=W6ML49_9ASCO|nr:uncharacterized protein KUCA_T00003153001 [Kuraishia capsulata CBS 1993]CDK27176.1 unnamed protein product [Kuraishia capsulata CBS 1993]
MFHTVRAHVIRPRLRYTRPKVLHTWTHPRPTSTQQMNARTNKVLKHLFLDGNFIFLGTNLIAIGFLPFWLQKRVAGTVSDTVESRSSFDDMVSMNGGTPFLKNFPMGPVTMSMENAGMSLQFRESQSEQNAMENEGGDLESETFKMDESLQLPLTPDELTTEIGVPVYPLQTRATEVLIDTLCTVACIEDGYMSILAGNNEGKDGKGETYLQNAKCPSRLSVTESLWNATGKTQERVESLNDLVDLIPDRTLTHLKKDFHKGLKSGLKHIDIRPAIRIAHPYGNSSGPSHLQKQLQAVFNEHHSSHSSPKTLVLALSQILKKYPQQLTTESYKLLLENFERMKYHELSYGTMYSLLDPKFQVRNPRIDFYELRHYIQRICSRQKISLENVNHLF